jgi:thiamine biosynthesis lipoprotein
MNTDIELLLYPGTKGLKTFEERAKNVTAKVVRLFEKTEKSLSRFDPNSELSRLNTEGLLQEASPLLYNTTCAALKMAELTSGVYDPTILNALENAGYNQSFELLAQSGITAANRVILPCLNKYREVCIESAQHTIRLPANTRLDLGGIAKGMTVDRAVKLLKDFDFKNFMLSAGGDMYLGGDDLDRKPGWHVEVQNPFTLSDNLLVLDVTNCGVATSSITKRCWQQGERQNHHLIDPRTAQPVENSLACVTVVAPSVRLADVLAKTALILGAEEGRQFIEQQPGCSALFIQKDGSFIRTVNLPAGN